MTNSNSLNFYLSSTLRISYDISEDKTISVGRHNDNDVVFESNLVSSKHAQIEIKDGSVFIKDLDSTNGSYLNGKKIEPNKLIELSKDSVILFASLDSCMMKVVEKEEKKSKKEIEQKSIKTIGRAEDCDIVINDITISRHHASIENKGNGVFILKDLNSTNGTYFNDRKITTVELKTDEQFIIGKYLFSSSGEYSRLDRKTVVRVNSVSKTYSNGKKAIQPMSFTINPKTLTAIMGPSGCGKSTLLKMLNGVIKHTSGQISLFDLDLNKNFNYFKHQIGYVPQDDNIHKELTVYQSLYYSAKIRLENYGEQEIHSKIKELLQKLRIEEIKHHKNSEISGGQRKRVCIAVELLSDPMLLLLDEPTSPLDPQSIEEFMSILKELTEHGTTIILVTHKPEDLQFMDEVIFLAHGGRLAFKGKIDNYLNHFKVKNIVEVYSLLAEHDSNFSSNSRSFNTHNTENTEYTRENKANWSRQLYWLTSRAIKIKTNDKSNLMITILQAPIIAILIGFIFNKVTLGVLFMMIISAIWFGVNNASREIVKERNIFERERLFNVYNSSYLLSKFNVLFLIGLVQTFLFVLILFVMYGSSETPLNSPTQLSVWLLLVNIVSSAIGLFISTIMKTSDKVLSIVPIILIPQLMLSGVITKLHNGFIEFMSYFTLSRWGTEGIAHIQKKIVVNDLEKQDAIPLLNANYDDLYSEIFGNMSGKFSLDASVLIAIGFCLVLITYTRLRSEK